MHLALGLLIVCAGAAPAALAADKEMRLTGDIVTLDVDTREMVVRHEVGSSSEDTTFVVADDAVIRVHGLKGNLDRLKPGDMVTVKYVRKDNKNVATEILHC